MPPVTLARHVGLLKERGGNRFGRALLMRSDLEKFAAMVRLTPGEAQALTVVDWHDRYPPIGRSLAKPYRTRSGNYFDRWLFSRNLRHCPECLSGDGSAIQDAYGGPWEKIWRLPVAFACLEHGSYLAEGCGAAHAVRLGAPPLFPNSAVTGLHPVQCRQPQARKYGRDSPACGNRLDRQQADAARPSQQQLETMRQILDQLRPSTDAKQAARFFTDLRVVAVLLGVISPSRWHTIDPTGIEPVDEHLRLGDSPADLTLDKPPRDVAATAALLTTAAAVLDSPARQDVLADLLRASWRTAHMPNSWNQVFNRIGGPSQSVLRKSLLITRPRR